jgi:hypothetical protein
MPENNDPASEPTPNEGWEWGLEDEKVDQPKPESDRDRFGTEKDDPSRDVPKEEVVSVPGKRFGVSSDFLNESDPFR